jgi:hypothetical protein
MARRRRWRNPAKERFWRKAVRGWQRSGLGIRVYCVKKHLNENNFHAWRRELVRRDAEKNERQGRSRPGKPPPNLFVPVQAVSSACPGRIEIILSAGRTVRVDAGFDRLALRDVLTTLEALPC